MEDKPYNSQQGIDRTFLQFGIRTDDMQIIKDIAAEHEVNFEWLQNLLEDFYSKKVKNQNLEDKHIEKIVTKALKKLPDYLDNN
ncbi:MAG: hypothetical protein JJT94_17055 [Bernardetiaceae bacterium]|nr:hypothetical protein [Bernardetiaceae bacterium]